MVGLNVNLKVVRNLKAFVQSDDNDAFILHFGTCGVHTVDCVFKGAITVTS